MKILYKILNRFPFIIDLVYSKAFVRVVPCIGQLFLACFFWFLNLFSGKRFYYQFFDSLCWIYRAGDIRWVNQILFPLIENQIYKIQKKPELLISSFNKTNRAKRIRALFSNNIKDKKKLYGNYIILKRKGMNEKGVLLLKFAETFEGLVLFTKIEEIIKNYHVVLEMSWDGVCDPTYFLFLNPNHKVFVETSSYKDYLFLKEKIHTNLIPVHISSNDWVDIDAIKLDGKDIEKKYDIAMVANWSIFKNHRKLFEALEKLDTDKVVDVVLIGFPWDSRSKEDVISEYNKIIIKKKQFIKFTLLEKVAHPQVLNVLQQSRFLVLLTYKEGGNKAVAESFICNTPVIVYENLKGGVLEKVNEKTGMASSFKDLHKNIQIMLGSFRSFEPRSYYLENFGAVNSTKKLNEVIKAHSGDTWSSDIVIKINSPGLQYLSSSLRDQFAEDYSFIESTFVIN